jgi:hypothetical protein
MHVDLQATHIPVVGLSLQKLQSQFFTAPAGFAGN